MNQVKTRRVLLCLLAASVIGICAILSSQLRTAPEDNGQTRTVQLDLTPAERQQLSSELRRFTSDLENGVATNIENYRALFKQADEVHAHGSSLSTRYLFGLDGSGVLERNKTLVVDVEWDSGRIVSIDIAIPEY